MGSSQLVLDPHTQSRLEAALLLLKEADPGMDWDRPEVLRRALDEGLRVLIAELLSNGRRRGRPLPFSNRLKSA